jgi:hypothetical protein
LEFFAFRKKQPGTIRVAIGKASIPNRIMLNHPDFDQATWNSGKMMNHDVWKHLIDFWAYPTKQPGTIRIAVGHLVYPTPTAKANISNGLKNPKVPRSMINHKSLPQSEWENGAKMDVAPYSHHMEFWVYPSKEVMLQTSNSQSLQPSVNGVVAPAEDSNALAEALLELEKYKELLKKYENAASTPSVEIPSTEIPSPAVEPATDEVKPVKVSTQP